MKFNKIQGNILLLLTILLLTACNDKTGNKSAGADGVVAEVTTEVKTEAVTEVRTEAATEEKSEAATEVKTEAATEVKTEAKTKAVTEAKTEAKTEAATEAKTEAKTEAATEAKTEAKTEAVTEAKTEAKTEAATETATKSNNADAGWEVCTFMASKYCDSVENVKMFVSDPFYFTSFKVRFENLPAQEKLNIFISIKGSTTDGYSFAYECMEGSAPYFSLYDLNSNSFVQFSSNKYDWGMYEDENFGNTVIKAGKEYDVSTIFMNCFKTELFDLSAHDFDWSTVTVSIGFSIGEHFVAEEDGGQWYTWSFN